MSGLWHEAEQSVGEEARERVEEELRGPGRWPPGQRAHWGPREGLSPSQRSQERTAMACYPRSPGGHPSRERSDREGKWSGPQLGGRT